MRGRRTWTRFQMFCWEYPYYCMGSRGTVLATSSWTRSFIITDKNVAIYYAGLLLIDFRLQRHLVNALARHQRAHLLSPSNETKRALDQIRNTDIARPFLQLNPLSTAANQLPAWRMKYRDRTQRRMYMAGNNQYARKLLELPLSQLPPVLLGNLSRVAQQRAVLFYLNT